MTIVIGIKTADRIYIASDSRLTTDYCEYVCDDKEKVFEYTYLGKPLIVGIAGNIFHDERIFNEFIHAKNDVAHYRFDYEFSDFALKYRKDRDIKDDDYTRFVISYDNELYTFTSCNTLEDRRLAVIGSAIDFAEGYISAILDPYSHRFGRLSVSRAKIEDALKLTVNACARHNLLVGGPVQIKSIPILTSDINCGNIPV
jgi:ATP-dependent protease HslVU (ClpYQ) peptidase subunit